MRERETSIFVKRTSLKGIREFDWSGIYKGMMMRGEKLKITNDIFLEVIFVGESTTLQPRAFFASRERDDLVYEVPLFRNPWDMMAQLVQVAREDLSNEIYR